MENKLNLVNIQDVETANRIIVELNEKKEVRVDFKTLTPLSLYMIHNSMKQMNCSHCHALGIRISVNGDEYVMNPLDADNVVLYPEFQNDAYYIQIYGWNHVGDYMGCVIKILGIICGYSQCYEPEFRKKYIDSYPFKPAEPNGFIDFDYNTIDKEKSYIELHLNKYDDIPYVSGTLYLHISTDKEVEWYTI